MSIPSLSSLLPHLIKHWKNYAIAVFIATNILTVSLLRDTHKTLVDTRIAHATTVATFKQAQKDANANAKRIKDNLEKEAKANAQKADAQYADLLDQYRANLLRYQQASRSLASRPSDYQYQTPELSVGAGTSTQVPTVPDTSLVITFSDADICAVNTARLQAAHEWAKNLPTR